MLALFFTKIYPCPFADIDNQLSLFWITHYLLSIMLELINCGAYTECDSLQQWKHTAAT